MLEKEIANLLAYAESSLMLDELDKAQAARRICALIGLDGYVETEPDLEVVDLCQTPNRLVAPLIEYAAKAKPELNAYELRAQILDAVMLRPSEINDLFSDTYAVNKQKAFDFLYDYCVKDGYVDLELCAKNDRWEAKELKSKIEIIINLMPQATTDGYPLCPLCKENEGWGDHANMRTVFTEIDGEEWFFNFSRHQYFDRHGVISSAEHTPMKEGADMIKKLALAADFIGADGFVGTNAVAENSGAKNVVHEHFQTGFKSTPMLKAAVGKKIKSKQYPYLDMGIVDWYSTVIRFSHSNLEKIVEFAALLAEKWKNYSDERIANPDGKKNFCNIVVRKADGKYTFDMVLRSNGLKKHRTSPEYDEIKADALSLTDVLGYFVLPNTLSERLKEVQLYLDGTVPFDAGALPATMKPFAKMIERMLKEQGGTVTKLEAKLNVHDEIDAVCEKILASTAVFDKETIKPFLESLDIIEL